MKQLFLLAPLALACATTFGAIRAVTPDMYGGNTNAWQVKRHNEKMKTVEAGGSKVVFIGDSITHFWEGKEQWKKYFAGEPYRALDLGTSADRTEHVLWRITEGKELDGYEAKCILLMIGTNNSGHFPFEKEPPLDTILGIREIVKVIRAKQPTAKLVLTAIFPRGRDFSDGYRRRNEVVNKEICKFADGKDIFWVDFNDQFLTPEGLLSPEVFPDRLHPNERGYEIWYAAVKPYVDYALSLDDSSDRSWWNPAGWFASAKEPLPLPANRYAPFFRKENVRMDEPIAAYPATRVSGLNDGWLNRLLEKRNQIADAKGSLDVVFLGDSITHGWDGAGKESFAELSKTYSIVNLGIGGDRTEHTLWIAENGGLDGYSAKCIMLMIGTNNTWHRKDRPEIVAEGVKRILEAVAKKQPQAKTLLIPIFPFGDRPDHPNRVNNEKINALIKPYADGQKVIWVDFNAKFLDKKGDNVKYMGDHCHPNAAGYREIWMPSVLPYFKEIVGK